MIKAKCGGDTREKQIGKIGKPGDAKTIWSDVITWLTRNEKSD
jgi:hypothetical protein